MPNAVIAWSAALAFFVLTTPPTPSIRAATYFVAQQAPDTSDQNAGTEQRPWKTLAHAARMAKPGDTVYIRAGTYRGRLNPASDGVTFNAWGDDPVILVPEDQVTLIKGKTWRRVADHRLVYACEPAVDGIDKKWLLRVDGRAVAFEVTQGVRRETVDSVGSDRETIVDRILDDHDRQRWTVDRQSKLYLNLNGLDPARHRVELIRRGSRWHLFRRQRMCLQTPSSSQLRQRDPGPRQSD